MGATCDGRGMGSTAGVRGSAQGSWDVGGRQDCVGFVPVGLQGWAVPALALWGWSFQPCLGHHVKMRHAHLEVECLLVSTASLFIPANSP